MNFRTKFLLWAGMSLSTMQLAKAASPDYFRLVPGSTRVYRAENQSETTKIRVAPIGVPHDEHLHYELEGYVDRPVLAYRNEANGALYYLDEHTNADVLLTSVDANLGTFDAPFRGCNQLGAAIGNESGYAGPAGAYDRALTVRYQTFGCYEAGVINERYVENLGLVQRTLMTVEGPVTYQLVHSSIDTVSITEAPSAALTLALRQPDPSRIVADLYWNRVGQPFKLTSADSQEYDVVLRNSAGLELWRWSDGRVFRPGLNYRYSRNLTYEVEIPLQINGFALPAGLYTVEAWLTTIPEKQFAAAGNFLRILPEPASEERRR